MKQLLPSLATVGRFTHNLHIVPWCKGALPKGVEEVQEDEEDVCVDMPELCDPKSGSEAEEEDNTDGEDDREASPFKPFLESAEAET